ncbi:MAG: RrF2 family transcriptional regulator [Clostridia bacterium]|nr:RrF2 family transcriptional regulator [Clostridia bacterium]
MMISTKGRYALRVMLDLAAHADGSYVRLSSIAERQNISEKYLESILVVLSKAGLLDALRGKGGGYRLIKTACEYTVHEILQLTEGSLAPVRCLEQGGGCERAGVCLTLPLWEGLDRVIETYLRSYTLEDILQRKVAL